MALREPILRLPLAVMALILVLAAGVGCGHPATDAECQIIVDRNIELQLKADNVTDPVAIAKKQLELREKMREPIKERCLGKRITDSMIQCVKLANSPAEANNCLD